jgi:hypothetical protein
MQRHDFFLTFAPKPSLSVMSSNAMRLRCLRPCVSTVIAPDAMTPVLGEPRACELIVPLAHEIAGETRHHRCIVWRASVR